MRILPAIAALTIFGCASAPPAPSSLPPAGPKPTEAQVEAVIREYLGRTLKDPESVKQFAITRGPYEKTYRALLGQPWHNGWVVCFEYNAKNSYGGYVGVKPGAITIQGSPQWAPWLLDPIPDFALNLYC